MSAPRKPASPPEAICSAIKGNRAEELTGAILDALSKAGWAFIRPRDETAALGTNVVQAHAVIRQIAEYAEAVASQAGVGSSETAGVIVSFLCNRPGLMPEFMAGTLSTIDVGMLDHHNGALSWHGQDGKIYDPDPSKARFAAPAAEICPGCKGDRWVDDQNWSPAYPDILQERVTRDGRIPCARCNFAGWNEPDGAAPSEERRG